MDALAGYGSGSDSDGAPPPQRQQQQQQAHDPTLVIAALASKGASHAIVAAPPVAAALAGGGGASAGAVGARFVSPHAATVSHNPTVAEMYTAVEGPANAGMAAPSVLAANARNHMGGHVEMAGVTAAAFDAQMYGTAPDNVSAPVAPAAVPGAIAHMPPPGAAVAAAGVQGSTEGLRAGGTKRKADGSAANPWFAKLASSQRALTAEQEDAQKRMIERRAAAQEAAKAAREAAREEEDGGGGNGSVDPADLPAASETSTWHGKDLVDYQGRSWLAPAGDAKRQAGEQCYVPKRLVHTYAGHKKGVNAVRFFPGSGHLLLSASMDGDVKIWDVMGNRRVMRTYSAHSAAVRDIQFGADGSAFVSAAYDRNVRLWDTETGAVTATFRNGKIPYCAVIHPDADKQNIVLTGMGDNKIYQWDTRTGNVEQEYDYHLAPVNSITFIDDNRRFVSSSDDKTLRVWDYGVPIQIKLIAEPGMMSMPSVALHPGKKWFCCQSLDNTIVTYGARDRFMKNNKKIFRGHNNAGYACQVSFSHDGKYVLSGDGEGRAYIWDFKTGRYVKNLKAHDGVCLGATWHPINTSTIATCGWGTKASPGTIKLWD